MTDAASFPALRRNQRLQLGDQNWKIIVYRVPYEAQVDIEVGVYESVSHPHDFTPGYIRIPLPRFGTQAGRRFSNDLHRLEYCELTPSIPRELGVRQPVRESHGFTGRNQHIQQT